MPVAAITMNKSVVDLGIFKSAKKNRLTLNTTGSGWAYDALDMGIDLLFDKGNAYEYSVWEKAILKAQEINRSKANLLKRARDEISLLASLNDPTFCSKSFVGRILKRRSSAFARLNGPSEPGK